MRRVFKNGTTLLPMISRRRVKSEVLCLQSKTWTTITGCLEEKANGSLLFVATYPPKAREKADSEAWKAFNTKSMLGGELLGQMEYVVTEPLLRAGYEGMRRREAKVTPRPEPVWTKHLND